MASYGMPQACEVSPPDMGGLTVAAPSGFEPPLSAASLVHDYVEWKEKLCGREWGTIRTYRRHLRMYLDWLDGRTLDGVTRRQVERYVSRPRRGGAPAKPTVRLEVTILRDFYRWAYETGHLPDNPLSLLRAPAQADEQANPLDDETWCAVWNAPLEDTDRLIFGLGYFGGLRRMEMGSLRGEHVDIEGQRLVRFRRKGGGNDTLALGTGMRVVEQRLPQLAPQDASEAFWRALHRSARHPDALVLALPPDGGGPRRASLRGQAVWRRIGRVCEAVGVERFNPHRLRHSCATNLVRAGVPVETTERRRTGTVAIIDFGGVKEEVITRKEFSMARAHKVLKNETIAVIGYGVQGPAQALNMKDNGFNVIVGQSKQFARDWDRACKDGWKPGKNLFDDVPRAFTRSPPSLQALPPISIELAGSVTGCYDMHAAGFSGAEAAPSLSTPGWGNFPVSRAGA